MVVQLEIRSMAMAMPAMAVKLAHATLGQQRAQLGRRCWPLRAVCRVKVSDKGLLRDYS